MYLCSDLFLGFCTGYVQVDPATVATIGETIPARSTELTGQDFKLAFLAGFSPILTLAMAAFAVKTVKRLLGFASG